MCRCARDRAVRRAGSRPRLETGADDFLTKPVHDAALQARIPLAAALKMAGDSCGCARRRRRASASNDSGTGTGLVDGRNGTILVVDDNRATAVGWERALATDATRCSPPSTGRRRQRGLGRAQL